MFSFIKKPKHKNSSFYAHQQKQLAKERESIEELLGQSEKKYGTGRKRTASGRPAQRSAKAHMTAKTHKSNTLEPSEHVQAIRMRRKYVDCRGLASNSVRRQMHEGLLLMALLGVAIAGSLTWLLSVLNEG